MTALARSSRRLGTFCSLGLLLISSSVVAESATPLSPAPSPPVAPTPPPPPPEPPQSPTQTPTTPPTSTKPADPKTPPNAPEADDEPASEQEQTAPPRKPTRRHTALEAKLTLKVKSPEETRAKLEALVLKRGGFPILVTNRAMELKAPPEHMSTLLEFVAAQGILIDKTLEREDLTLEVNKLEGELKSKRAILAELRSFFDQSNVAATLQIETSMTELVQELERVKGQLRVLHDRSRWAVIHIAFEFRERQKVNYAKSEFEWLNTVDLDRFLETF